MGVADAQKVPWGVTRDGAAVDLYTLHSDALTVRITNYGAHIVSIEAPDRAGRNADVVLGYKDLAGYEADTKSYMGSVVGRYGNRIGKGTFQLDGKTYHVPVNDKQNALHGGAVGFDRKVWSARALPHGVELTLVSADGEMGFPGMLTVHVRYTLEGSSLHIAYSATSTRSTVVNLTNHSYFNLAGESSGTVLAQRLTLYASRYTLIDKKLIPTGQVTAVEGTPFDFRQSTPIGSRIAADDEQLHLAGGYDHNWVLDGTGMRVAARALDPASGRTLTVSTDEPGVQFYSGNSLDGAYIGVGGVPYAKYAGFCLETQHFPDSPNRPEFPTTELRPGQTLRSETVFTFGVEK